MVLTRAQRSLFGSSALRGSSSRGSGSSAGDRSAADAARQRAIKAQREREQRNRAALQARSEGPPLLPDDQIAVRGRASVGNSRGGTNTYTPGNEYAPPAKRAGATQPTQPTRPTGGGGGGGGGAGGGGGSGGGGGGGEITPEPPVLDLDAIRDALSAISAQFDFQEGELSAEQEAARRGFEFLQETLGEQREGALTGLESEAAGRGLLRSGLFLRDAGDTEEEFARQESRAQSETDAKLAGLERNIANLKAQEETKRANEARRLAQEQVGTQEAISRALELV